MRIVPHNPLPRKKKVYTRFMIYLTNTFFFFLILSKNICRWSYLIQTISGCIKIGQWLCHDLASLFKSIFKIFSDNFPGKYTCTRQDKTNTRVVLAYFALSYCSMNISLFINEFYFMRMLRQNISLVILRSVKSASTNNIIGHLKLLLIAF